MNEQNTVEEHLRTLSGRKLEYRRIVTNDELKKTKKKTGRSTRVEESRPNNWSLND